MKKTITTASDMKHTPKQGLEQSKKLYRTVTELAKRLDDARTCARSIGDLFAPTLLSQRRKFCDCCTKLIFADPLLYGKKGEELLWRKGFYDVVSASKKLKRKEYTLDQINNVLSHLNGGIGFYHHLLSKVQLQSGLDLASVIDFPCLMIGGEEQPDLIEWAKGSVHQILVYLGDLSRYKLDIYPNNDPNVTIRYYLQAISYRSDYGMPHNQMGTLAMNQNRFLDAVYHYMRCLACKFTFEGTNNNLISLLDKNSKYLELLPVTSEQKELDARSQSDIVKQFISRFLLLIDIWYFDKTVSKVYDLCHQTYKDLEQCLNLAPKLIETDSSDSQSTQNDPDYLSNDMVFKITIIIILCIEKLQKVESQHSSTAVAFLLAVYSQLVQNIVTYIQESVLNYPLADIKPDNCTKNGIVTDLLKINRGNERKRASFKLRRRKVILNDSDVDSENEANNVEDLSSSDSDSFESNDDVLVNSSDDDEDDKELNGDCSEEENHTTLTDNNNQKRLSSNKVIKKIKRMDVNDMLEIVTEKSYLQSIKIINDFLMQDTDILKSCGKTTRSLFRQITNMLNMVNINIKSQKLSGVKLDVSAIIKNESKIPLSEDIILKGLEMLAKSHKTIDWDYSHRRAFNMREETVVRIVKFLAFGKSLTGIEETGVSFHERRNVFVCQVEKEDKGIPNGPDGVAEELEPQENDTLIKSVSEGEVKDDDGGGRGSGGKGGHQLMKMKHMGQLWLASEVRALESRVRGKAALSPYLVLDADALIKSTYMVKQLVQSRKFIVVIPSAVVSALDDLKKEQSEARDAIRWLESQFHRGNRFFRAQRPQERAPIPFIKYPKKRDKEMSTYIHIIECCHFLAEQQKGASNLVTLLIGNQNVLSNGENKEFSYVGLAQSAGVSIESITHFFGKWKKSYKGKR